MLLLACFPDPSSAQLPGVGVPRNPDGGRSAALHDLDRLPERSQKAEHAKTAKAEREFLERLADFAKAWNALMKVREDGVWSAKQARRAHKAFERLVRSQGWVENPEE